MYGGNNFGNLIKDMASCRWGRSCSALATFHKFRDCCLYKGNIDDFTTMTCGIRNKQLQIMY